MLMRVFRAASTETSIIYVNSCLRMLQRNTFPRKKQHVNLLYECFQECSLLRRRAIYCVIATQVRKVKWLCCPNGMPASSLWDNYKELHLTQHETPPHFFGSFFYVA